MKSIRRILAIGAGLILSLNHLRAQQTDFSNIHVSLDSTADIQAMLAAIESVSPIPYDATSRQQKFGTFWSAQHPEGTREAWPPLPGNIFGLPVWPLGDGHFLLDDRNLDYAEIQAEEEVLAALEKAALPRMKTGRMSLTLSSSQAYGNPVYLTNLVVTAGMTARFDIGGGTNFVPYDIQMSTNLLSDWNWLGIGYTANNYTFSNQPPEQAFYRLAKPVKTMVVAWGENYFNQCDPPLNLTNAIQIAGGGGYTVALLNNGTVVGWGDRVSEGSVPTNLTGVAMIASGINHKTVLLTNGVVLAWGDNFYGEISVPTDLTNATMISAQYLHTLALRKDGTVVSWGDTSNPSLTNVPAGLTNATAIAAGCNHNLAVKADGTVVAWGDNTYGQCNVPTGLSNVWDVAAGWTHSVALKKDGTMIAWGHNAYGETNVPAGLSNVVAIAASGYPLYCGYTLALKKDGTVVAWGLRKAIAPLNGLNNVIALGAEYDSGLAIRTGPPTPVVTLEPLDQYQVAGGNVTFEAKGAGLYGVTYQWQTNNVNLSGATNTTLLLTNLAAAHQGAYRLVVTDNGGQGTLASSNANFSLVTPPVIVSQSLPTNPVCIYGNILNFNATATGVGQTNGFPLHYQWQFNGTNIGGANTNSYALLVDSPTLGNYSVIIANAAGSVTSLVWQVSMTYVGSYIDVGTLAYHLSTNAVGHTNGFTPAYNNTVCFSGWTSGAYSTTNMAALTNSTWSTNFWLKGVHGLSATCLGFSNAPAGTGGQGPMNLISPRHYICVTHMHPESYPDAFLDTNNVIYWRRSVQRVDIGNDTSIGILDADLPSSVEYFPVIPTNFSSYIPTNGASIIQGIGMNQQKQIFGQPMAFSQAFINWSTNNIAPLGLTTNWNVPIVGGDSSCPEMLLVGNQLVLTTDNSSSQSGASYGFQFEVINQKMHYLSTNNAVGTDYQLTPISFTNWSSIH